MTQPTYQGLAGLQVPTGLVGRLVAAIRWKYAKETTGVADDAAAVRLALKVWLSQTLAEHEAWQAQQPRDMEVAQVITSYEHAVQQAKQTALKDATAINDGPPPARAVTPGDIFVPQRHEDPLRTVTTLRSTRRGCHDTPDRE